MNSERASCLNRQLNATSDNTIDVYSMKVERIGVCMAQHVDRHYTQAPREYHSLHDNVD
jgi:hypothetical protein